MTILVTMIMIMMMIISTIIMIIIINLIKIRIIISKLNNNKGKCTTVSQLLEMAHVLKKVLCFLAKDIRHKRAQEISLTGGKCVVILI